jgi:lysophospholipase L1-like esterase
MGRRVILMALALVTSLVAGCGSPNGPGPVVVPPAPQITCGGALTVETASPTSAEVTYPAPVVTGGAAPVSVACSPASGGTFPFGMTPVTCNASDTQGRQASCSFTVTVTHKEIAVTRFLAFGDSITLGENGRRQGNLQPFVDAPNAYPTFLQQLFNERIPSQQITVINAGLGGERVSSTDTNERLKGALAKYQPQVVLLLEGINDLNEGIGQNAILNGLRDHIRTAHDRGVPYVVVSTILPPSRDACLDPNQIDPPCRAKSTPAGQPASINQSIRALASPSAGTFVVDPYDEFVANRTTYLEIDGLHLRPAGNVALANAFWNRIVEVIPARQLFGGS